MDKEAKTILDVGCGKGEPMKFINRRKQFYAAGTDIFEPYLREAKQQQVHDEYIRCDVRRLPFKSKSFDIVLCLEVLEHLEKEAGEELLQAMEGLARRQVLLTTPVGKYSQKPYDGNPSQEHRHIWHPAELKEKGYQAVTLGLRDLGGEEGLSTHLPGFVKPLSYILWVLAGPFARLFPRLAGEMVCCKRLNTK
jgi:SAM-dependent methyltransferase